MGFFPISSIEYHNKQKYNDDEISKGLHKMKRRFCEKTICETLLYLSPKPLLDNEPFNSYTKTRVDIRVNY